MVAIYCTVRDQAGHLAPSFAIMFCRQEVVQAGNAVPASCLKFDLTRISDRFEIRDCVHLEIVETSFEPNSVLFPEYRDFGHPAGKGIRKILVGLDEGRGR